MAENVSASEIMNSHIPNFFDPIAYGDPPPCQTESIATALASDMKSFPPKQKKCHQVDPDCTQKMPEIGAPIPGSPLARPKPQQQRLYIDIAQRRNPAE